MIHSRHALTLLLPIIFILPKSLELGTQPGRALLGRQDRVFHRERLSNMSVIAPQNKLGRCNGMIDIHGHVLASCLP